MENAAVSISAPSSTQRNKEEEQGSQISLTLHLWHTQTHTHSQETHLKSLRLFVSVSISPYTSCTTELIEKVKKKKKNGCKGMTEERKVSPSAQPKKRNKALPNLFIFMSYRSILSFMNLPGEQSVCGNLFWKEWAVSHILQS